MKHVIALFDGIDDSLRAIGALERDDLPSSRVTVLVRGGREDLPKAASALRFEEGRLANVGRTMVAGPLAALMRSPVAPNVEVDLVETLVAAGMRPHQAIRYQWALRHGKSLLITTVGTAKAERVARVLSLCRPIERVSAA